MVSIYLPYSTLAMRSAGGLEVIKKAVEQLSKYHDRHIRLYDPTMVSIPNHKINWSFLEYILVRGQDVVDLPTQEVRKHHMHADKNAESHIYPHRI